MKTTVITGGSSGIGAELARRYAAKGERVILLARRKERLEAIQKECEALGGDCDIYVVDVADFRRLQAIAQEIAKRYERIDRIIFNAGISIGHSLDITPFADLKRLYEINLLSAHALLEPLLPKLLSEGVGHLVFISSLASLIAMPSSIAYSSSKRALNAYAEGLNYKYKRKGLHVSIILPGFIDTELTQKNGFKMPFFMDLTRGVDAIERAIAQKRYYYAFPLRFYLIIRALMLLPQALREKIIDYYNYNRGIEDA